MGRLLFALGLCVAACTPNFQSASQVTDLRILAMQVDPPEALVDLDAGTVQEVRLNVLVADPAARAEGVMKGGLCFPTDNLKCSLDPRQTSLLPTLTQPVGQIFSYDLRLPAGALSAALQNDKLKGLGGIRVQSTLEVTDGDPRISVGGSKLLLFNAAAPGYLPNHNPVLSGLLLSTSDGKPVRTLTPGQLLSVQTGVAMGILPLHTADQSESYCTTDLTGKKTCLTELLSYSFFSTLPGDLDEDSAYDPLPGYPLPPSGLVRFTALAPGTGTLWIVVRDGRGGESWLSFDWTAN